MYDSRHSGGSGQGFFLLVIAVVIFTCIAGMREKRAERGAVPETEANPTSEAVR